MANRVLHSVARDPPQAATMCSKFPLDPPEGEAVTSDKQTRANRRNALKSTGPTTPEGKGAASQNALTHGLLSKEVLLPEEDGAALAQLSGRLRGELRPVGELEGCSRSAW